MSIGPGGFLVVCRNAAAMAASSPRHDRRQLQRFALRSQRASSSGRRPRQPGGRSRVLRRRPLAPGGRRRRGEPGTARPAADNRRAKPGRPATRGPARSGKPTPPRRRLRRRRAAHLERIRLGLLDAGEVLIDDVSVIEDPAGAARQLIQNGSFDSGLNQWRVIGNHRARSCPTPQPHESRLAPDRHRPDRTPAQPRRDDLCRQHADRQRHGVRISFRASGWPVRVSSMPASI